MVYKNDVIENSNMIDLLLFSILLFVKAIAECNVPLEWIKNKDKLTMVKMVKQSDKGLIEDTPITSSKLSEKSEDDEVKWGEVKWENLNPIKDQGKQKSNQFHGDGQELGGEKFKKNTLFTSVL